MKKILSCMLYGVIALFGVIFLLYIYFFVMDKDNRKSIMITDFSKNHSLTVYGKERFYEVERTTIKGYVNDTIIVHFNPVKIVKLSGEIDYEFRDVYLGKDSARIYIDSYKATKGRLKVRHGFY